MLWSVIVAFYGHTRVKSGKFGQSAKFGQRHCFFYLSITGIKIKLTKQTVKILMRRLSRLIWIFTVCKRMSEFTRSSKLPDFSLITCVFVKYQPKLDVTVSQQQFQVVSLETMISYNNSEIIQYTDLLYFKITIKNRLSAL